jgi:L,D-transpeptidase-like protein
VVIPVLNDLLSKTPERLRSLVAMKAVALALGIATTLAATSVTARAQADTTRALLAATDDSIVPKPGSADLETVTVRRFTSRADSLDWEAARGRAERARGMRVVISLQDRRLWTMIDADTLMTAEVAVATDSTLEYLGKRWVFKTPRGARSVIRKEAGPVWVPPIWHYYEVAKERGLGVRELPRDRAIPLGDGRQLEVRYGVAGIRGWDGGFEELPTDEEIIFDNVLYIPPMGTKNRAVEGELGKYRLDLGQGYLLHGTPHQESIGQAATHGCIRLRDEDIAWLYEFVPVGTKVYIY